MITFNNEFKSSYLNNLKHSQGFFCTFKIISLSLYLEIFKPFILLFERKKIFPFINFAPLFFIMLFLLGFTVIIYGSERFLKMILNSSILLIVIQ